MKKPQQDGRSGAIGIKSTPILTGWTVHKQEDNYITEILPQKWKSRAPCQVPQPGGLTTGGCAPTESSFEDQQGLIAGIPQAWG